MTFQAWDIPITAFGRGMAARRELKEIVGGVIARRIESGDESTTDFVGSLLAAAKADKDGIFHRCILMTFFELHF